MSRLRQPGPDCPVDAVGRRARTFRYRQITVPQDLGGNAVLLFGADPRRIEAWIYVGVGGVQIAIGGRSVSFATSSQDPGWIINSGEKEFVNATTDAIYAVANSQPGADCRLVDLIDEDASVAGQ